jgi:hypothetical protein
MVTYQMRSKNQSKRLNDLNYLGGNDSFLSNLMKPVKHLEQQKMINFFFYFIVA